MSLTHKKNRPQQARISPCIGEADLKPSQSPRRLVDAVVAGWLLVGLAAFDAGAADETELQGKAAAATEAQAEVVRWVDEFAKVQVFFSPMDVERLQKEVAKFTPEEAEAWLERTKEVRESLESIEWQRTRLWLKEFLEVQAIYSDEQIEEFRQEAKQTARESPAKFKDLLAKVDEERRELLKGAASSAQLRQQQVHVVNAYRQKEFAARQAALKASAKQPKSSTPSNSSGPPKKTARKTPPLVDSMDAARWTIMQNFWRRR